MRIVLLCFVLLFGLASTAEAADSGARVLLDRGMAVYKSSGASAGFNALTKNGPLAGERTLSAVLNNLRTVEEALGPFEGHEIIREHEVTPRVRFIFFTMNYGKGPVYARITAYRLASGEWISYYFNFNTDPNEIVPAQVMFKE